MMPVTTLALGALGPPYQEPTIIYNAGTVTILEVKKLQITIIAHIIAYSVRSPGNSKSEVGMRSSWYDCFVFQF